MNTFISIPNVEGLLADYNKQRSDAREIRLNCHGSQSSAYGTFPIKKKKIPPPFFFLKSFPSRIQQFIWKYSCDY